jgi:hypothetical protein
MTPNDLRARVQAVTERIRGLAVDAALEKRLNESFPAGGEVFRGIDEACRAGIAEGWLCKQGGSGRRFGRVFEPAPDLAGYSVDVVELEDFVGPLHTHPEGEICLVMPVDATAKFIGRRAGWAVYPPKSGHRPAVSGGKAVVLYMLPAGRIEWAKTTAY